MAYNPMHIFATQVLTLIAGFITFVAACVFASQVSDKSVHICVAQGVYRACGYIDITMVSFSSYLAHFAARSTSRSLVEAMRVAQA